MNTMITDSLYPTAARVAPREMAEAAPQATSGDTRALPTGALFDAVGVVLDLSMEGRDLLGAYASLNPSDRAAFVDMLAGLLARGIVGTETVSIDNRPYQTDVVTRLGDPRLMHAAPYRDRSTGPSRVNFTA